MGVGNKSFWCRIPRTRTIKWETAYFAVLAIILLLVTKESTGSSDVTKNYKNEHYSAFDSASWAVTSDHLSPLLGVDKQSLYDGYIAACDAAILKKKKKGGVCSRDDQSRMQMNRDQPSSVYNYTKAGYAKTRLPTDLYDLIKEFFDENRHLAETEWKNYNVYHNAWQSPPTFINLEGNSVGGSSLTSLLEEKVKPILERWTGQRLSPVSTYGIRMYHNGSILSPHVDRMPLVTSVIIQVDQDVDEPWPLEVYGHDGTATNVTMEPGDMVLYESHSIIHGRPFPMIGNFFANCFIHFEPYEPIEGVSSYDPKLDIPPYLVTGSVWERDWKAANPNGWKGNTKGALRNVAAHGNAKKFEAMVQMNPADMHDKDANGWTVLHEAARSGHLEIVKTILKYGVDKNLLTNTGVTPLNIALQFLGGDHELVEYLDSIEAKNISPSRKYLRRDPQLTNNDLADL